MKLRTDENTFDDKHEAHTNLYMSVSETSRLLDKAMGKEIYKLEK